MSLRKREGCAPCQGSTFEWRGHPLQRNGRIRKGMGPGTDFATYIQSAHAPDDQAGCTLDRRQVFLFIATQLLATMQQKCAIPRFRVYDTLVLVRSEQATEARRGARRADPVARVRCTTRDLSQGIYDTIVQSFRLRASVLIDPS
jgi:hypothetical protein